MSTNVPPASRKRSSIRWDSSRGVAAPMSIVPRHIRLTVSGPRVVVSIRVVYPPSVALHREAGVGSAERDPTRGKCDARTCSRSGDHPGRAARGADRRLGGDEDGPGRPAGLPDRAVPGRLRGREQLLPQGHHDPQGRQRQVEDQRLPQRAVPEGRRRGAGPDRSRPVEPGQRRARREQPAPAVLVQRSAEPVDQPGRRGAEGRHDLQAGQALQLRPAARGRAAGPVQAEVQEDRQLQLLLRRARPG